MGDIAQLPVNLVLEQGNTHRFNGRHCPTPCQRSNHRKSLDNVSMGDIAQLPVNVDNPEEKVFAVFQWATLPNSLSTDKVELGQIIFVSMGDIAQLPVNPTPLKFPLFFNRLQSTLTTIKLCEKVSQLGAVFA